MSIDRSKHVFGSESDVDFALEHGLIDAYDILFLGDGRVGWIDRSGNKVIHRSKKQVVVIDELPENGDNEVLYIYDSKIYIWSDHEFICPSFGEGVDDELLDYKINLIKEEVLGLASEDAQIRDDSVKLWVQSKIPTEVSQLNNDKGYLTDSFVAQPEPPSDTSLLWIDTDDNSGNGFQEIVNETLDHAKATDEEILDLLIKEDFLPAVVDADGSLLADEDNNILLW